MTDSERFPTNGRRVFAGAAYRLWSAAVVTIIVVAFVAGCARWNLSKWPTSSGDKFFAVRSDTTAFYLHGPGQGGGPDKTLKKDTLVTVIRSSFGYSKVKLTTGEQGYVWNEDIIVAPPALVAAATETEATTPKVNLPSQPDSRPVPGDPLLEFEPTPIPQPTVPQN